MNALQRAVDRLRRRALSGGAETGTTLAEMLIAISILGLAVPALAGGIGVAASAADHHRKQVNASYVLRDFAEAMKERARMGGYMPLANAEDWLFPDGTGNPPVYAAPVGYEVAIDTSDPDAIQYESSTNLNVILVLDRSSSVEMGGGDDDLKNAAKAFLGSIKNKGAYASIVSFGNSSSAPDVAPRLVTDASLNEATTGFNARINALKFCNGGFIFGICLNPEYTNWDAGMVTAGLQLGGFPTNSPPLVVVVTDGNPNRWVDSGGNTQGSGDGLDPVALSEATAAADQLVAQGAKLFVIGVDGYGDLQEGSLKAVVHDTDGSREYDPVAFPTRRFEDSSWTAIHDYSSLGPVLSQIAADQNKEVFSTAKPTADQGTQRLRLTAYSTDRRDTETVDIIVRRP